MPSVADLEQHIAAGCKTGKNLSTLVPARTMRIVRIESAKLFNPRALTCYDYRHVNIHISNRGQK
jgi:hypothetical protein